MGDRTECDIDFVPIVAIKGQAIEDFIAKLTQVDTLVSWIFKVDGSSCNVGTTAGIKIVIPNQMTYEHSIQLQFTASYNMVEYKAKIHDLKLVKELGASIVKLRMDSKLVVRQSA